MIKPLYIKNAKNISLLFLVSSLTYSIIIELIPFKTQNKKIYDKMIITNKITIAINFIIFSPLFIELLVSMFLVCFVNTTIILYADTVVKYKFYIYNVYGEYYICIVK